MGLTPDTSILPTNASQEQLGNLDNISQLTYQVLLELRRLNMMFASAFNVDIGSLNKSDLDPSNTME